MAGETNLHTLLEGMRPTLSPETYVFCTLPPGESLPPGIVPFATVREDEGLTVIVNRQLAGELLSSEPFGAITLAVHSSLQSVGLIAVVTRALADAGIPSNAISGYHHDHVLVPASRCAEAVTILEGVARHAATLSAADGAAKGPN